MAIREKKSGGFYSKRIKKQVNKRPGVHAKSKTSKNKNSKHYRKAYKGQGR